MFRQRTHAESLRRIVAGVNDGQVVFFRVNSGPVWSLTDDQGVDAVGSCFSERFS